MDKKTTLTCFKTTLKRVKKMRDAAKSDNLKVYLRGVEVGIETCVNLVENDGEFTL